MRWQKIQAIAARHKNSQALAQLRAIENDKGLTADAKRDRSAPLRAQVERSYYEAQKEAAALVAEARESWQYHIPQAIQRRAASQKPERAQFAQSIGATAHGAELVRLAKQIAADDDSAAAYGLRVALSIRSDIADEYRGEVLRLLVDAGTAGHQDTLAELVATQRAFAHLQSAGEMGDAFAAMLRDPAAQVGHMNTSNVVPIDEDGRTAILSDSEANAHLIAAGMMQEPAGAAV